VVDEESGESKPAVDDEGKTIFQSNYTGQYAANLKDGEGVFEYPDGSKYQGNWKHDKRHGDGVYWYANGDIYSGEWRFGTKHGRGTFIHAESNAKLIGSFVDGKVPPPH
jgi:radial spoke head protein 1